MVRLGSDQALAAMASEDARTAPFIVDIVSSRKMKSRKFAACKGLDKG